ncbi:MAG TPA: hypothetical protein VJ976_04940 [Ornithinimicrobium sp.]|uniref:hypothetical protein n=1 Tax=Ornithinimicrobium sp. TaxID=1977084 RepID=UPI002B489086|nr:hypothetical protein [Ornithinimicrobium sp.]HKJ11720.1 hypothetical protein [Ornithinimicrobium sp.]
MSPEGPEDSPEVNEPTSTSAVEPLPPGSNAEEVVDAIDERIRESWKNMDSEDDTEMEKGNSPHGGGSASEDETEPEGGSEGTGKEDDAGEPTG